MDYSTHSLQSNLYFTYLGQHKGEIRPVRGRDIYNCRSKSLIVLENHINLTENLITKNIAKNMALMVGYMLFSDKVGKKHIKTIYLFAGVVSLPNSGRHR